MRCRETAQGNNRAHPSDAVPHIASPLVALAAAVRSAEFGIPLSAEFHVETLDATSESGQKLP